MARLPTITYERIDNGKASRVANSARVVEEDPALVTLLQAGRQQFALRQRPNHYYRFSPPEEATLLDIVEYDLDEGDAAWLRRYNQEQRRPEGLPDVPASLFEALIDRYEKEWFHLTKDLQRRHQENNVLHPEESLCAMCDDGECENSNAIVFCDGCNLAVHQDCYGVPYIPEGQWLCRKCMLAPEQSVECVLCPMVGGAFKQTTTSQWAHLLCALWIPEVVVANPVYLEPIDGINEIPKGRWKLVFFHPLSASLQYGLKSFNP